MTDYERLRDEVKSVSEEERYPKGTTLTELIRLVDKKTGKLPNKLYISEYAVDKKILFETLKKLGYNFEFEEEYNPYFEQFCYKVKLLS